jgi:hypothetical protein
MQASWQSAFGAGKRGRKRAEVAWQIQALEEGVLSILHAVKGERGRKLKLRRLEMLEDRSKRLRVWVRFAHVGG